MIGVGSNGSTPFLCYASRRLLVGVHMLSKQDVKRLIEDDLDQLYFHLEKAKSSSEVRVILENLGRLPDDFEGKKLLPYAQSDNVDTRYWAIKNIGKLSDPAYLTLLYEIALSDDDSMVRREAVSAIGRMRSERAIPNLLGVLRDDDPKIVLQALRGLLVFGDNPQVREAIQRLADHPNEQIQLVLENEFQEDNVITDYKDHLSFPDYMRNCVVLGDTRDTMQQLPDGVIHLTFTSPPYYNARDYSIYDSYVGYLDFLTDVFQSVYRLTKEGRFLIVNTSPVIVPRISRSYSSKRYPIPFDLHARLVDIGWEFIDDIVWAKPEASVKNRIGGFMQHRKPLGYKPNMVTEYLMVYRKKTAKLLDWNMKQYPDDVIEDSKVLGEYESSNLWEVDPKSDKVHSAIFPEGLCRRVIEYYSYQGDLIFDPFAGSGTLGKVASHMERAFFLTEANEQYFERIKENLGNNNLFQPTGNRFVSLQEFCNLIQQEGE